jgi:hypothetical protein
MDDIAATLIEQKALQDTPRWLLDNRNIFVGPYHSADELEEHVSQTCGSMEWLWSDTEELRFDPQLLHLVSAHLFISDTTVSALELLEPWFHAPVHVGVPKLNIATGVAGFQVPTTSARWMDAQGKAFICVLPSALDDKIQQRQRLQIGQDLELLIADNHYCGWSLLHPTRYLVQGWEEPLADEVNPALIPLVYDYLTLVTYPFIDDMEDTNTNVQQQLINLYERARILKTKEKRAGIVQAALASKLDNFYNMSVDD